MSATNTIVVAAINQTALDMPPRLSIPQWEKHVLENGEPILRDMGPVTLEKFLHDGMNCRSPIIRSAMHRRIVGHLKQGNKLYHWIENSLLVAGHNSSLQALGLERGVRAQREKLLPEVVPELEDEIAVTEADSRLPERAKKERIAALRSEAAGIGRRSTLDAAMFRSDQHGAANTRVVDEAEMREQKMRIEYMERELVLLREQVKIMAGSITQSKEAQTVLQNTPRK